MDLGQFLAGLTGWNELSGHTRVRVLRRKSDGCPLFAIHWDLPIPKPEDLELIGVDHDLVYWCHQAEQIRVDSDSWGKCRSTRLSEHLFRERQDHELLRWQTSINRANPLLASLEWVTETGQDP